ncbi:hypothetical protein ACIHEI_33940 [Kitasatospora sp. NPDC051984]|uniref:hypothetical protein n=1 Tax=Kitasatospora sp. NPDC051984 TaxID=3364059 RepID=UPI0037C54318
MSNGSATRGDESSETWRAVYALPDGAFSPSDWARVEFCQKAKWVGDAAVELVRFVAMDAASAGDYAKLAIDLAHTVSYLQGAAIVAERIRGASWADIARGLGESDVDAVQARWEGRVTAELARRPSGLKPRDTARTLSWVDEWSDKMPRPVASFPKGALGRVLDASVAWTGRDPAEADRAFAGCPEVTAS